jgi:hypothetical protein
VHRIGRRGPQSASSSDRLDLRSRVLLLLAVVLLFTECAHTPSSTSQIGPPSTQLPTQRPGLVLHGAQLPPRTIPVAKIGDQRGAEVASTWVTDGHLTVRTPDNTPVHWGAPFTPARPYGAVLSTGIQPVRVRVRWFADIDSSGTPGQALSDTTCDVNRPNGLGCAFRVTSHSVEISLSPPAYSRTEVLVIEVAWYVPHSMNVQFHLNLPELTTSYAWRVRNA